MWRERKDMVNNDNDMENLGITIFKSVERILEGIDRIDGSFPMKYGKHTVVVIEYSIYRMLNFIRIDVKRLPLPEKVVSD